MLAHTAVVVIGASAGGLAVVRRLLRELPARLPATMLVVVHQPRRPQQPLVALLSDGCALPVRQARGEEDLRSGEVLLAPPDQHLRLCSVAAHLDDGPLRNGVRPSVDELFDSAAEVFSDRVVAVVLSGSMRDGATGAAHVERAGGRVLVQDPSDAQVTGMPVSAIHATQEPAVASSDGLANALTRLVVDVVRGAA